MYYKVCVNLPGYGETLLAGPDGELYVLSGPETRFGSYAEAAIARDAARKAHPDAVVKAVGPLAVMPYNLSENRM